MDIVLTDTKYYSVKVKYLNIRLTISETAYFTLLMMTWPSHGLYQPTTTGGGNLRVMPLRLPMPTRNGWLRASFNTTTSNRWKTPPNRAAFLRLTDARQIFYNCTTSDVACEGWQAPKSCSVPCHVTILYIAWYGDRHCFGINDLAERKTEPPEQGGEQLLIVRWSVCIQYAEKYWNHAFYTIFFSQAFFYFLFQASILNIDKSFILSIL